MKRFLSKSVAVTLSQLILLMSLLLPYQAYAFSPEPEIKTTYLGRMKNGYYNFKFTLIHSSTNLTKTVTKAVSPQSLSKVLRYVVTKRVGAFTTLASIGVATGIEYLATDVLYTPSGSVSNRNIGVDTRDSGFVKVGNLNQACALAYIELAWMWSQLDPVGYQNCKWLGNSAVQMDLYEGTVSPEGCCWTKDLSLVANPNASASRNISDVAAMDLVLSQNPKESAKLVDPTLVPSSVLPTEVTQAIADLNKDLTEDQTYKPPYVAPAPTNNTATGGYGEGSMSLEFPVFCTWAGTICDSIDFIKEKVGTISDFFKEEPQQDTELDLPVDTPNIDTNIKFNGQCPAPLTYDFTYGGQAQSFGIKDFTPFCSMLNDILKPIVIAVSSFVAVLIIGGVRTDE
ncbi:virulence factor TspB C-terminal domain-related protein [Acinetobacter puyangensis]|uniref:virulence factor TspB C-terminal domain-related protein n=1 Tax=Acinetobacter puyangensis TaxID=1096779 RepID=UPI003A4E4B2A